MTHLREKFSVAAPNMDRHSSRRIVSAWIAAMWVTAIGSLLPGFILHSTVRAIPMNDKLIHFLIYTALAVLPVLGFGSFWTGLLCATLMIGFGALLEAAQLLVPERSAELADMAANASGVLIGIVLGWLWKAARKKEEHLR